MFDRLRQKVREAQALEPERVDQRREEIIATSIAGAIIVVLVATYYLGKAQVFG